MQDQLPQGITQVMIDDAKKKYGATGMVKLVCLEDSDGNDLGTVLMVRPNRAVIDQVERFVDTDPGKAYEILMNACLLSHKDMVAANDKMFAATISACMQMMPYSKPLLVVPDMDALPEGITADMIGELSKTRTDIRIALLQKNEDGDTIGVLVCAPQRKAITDHEKWETANPKKAKQYMIDSSLQSHKDEVSKNDYLWFAAYSAAVQLKPKGVARIKNC